VPEGDAAVSQDFEPESLETWKLSHSRIPHLELPPEAQLLFQASNLESYTREKAISSQCQGAHEVDFLPKKHLTKRLLQPPKDSQSLQFHLQKYWTEFHAFWVAKSSLLFFPNSHSYKVLQ
jgi:hypothetical protein